MDYATINAIACQCAGIKPTTSNVDCINRNIKPVQKAVITKIDTKGLYQYQFSSSNGLVIDCRLEYEKAFDGGTGPTSEPSYPERIELIYALINGVDMSEVLCDEVKTLIEEEALCSMEMDKWNDEADQGEAA